MMSLLTKQSTTSKLQKFLRRLSHVSENIDKPENNDLSYFSNTKDPKDNAATTPPSDEQVRVPSIWIFEAYPPSVFSNFLDGIANLGWIDDSQFLNPDILDSIEKMRSQSSGGGWLNIGYVVSDSTRTLFRTRQAPLPDGVSTMRASVLQPLPSTTILACQFFFEEEMAISLEEPLRTLYTTYKIPIEGGYTYQTVEHQKQAAIDGMRAYLRSLCTNWLSQYIPGYFSSQITDKSHPTCEMITLTKHRPYARLQNEEHLSFLRLLGLEHDFDAWICKEAQGLYLKLLREPGRAVLSGKIDEILSEDELKGFGNESRETKIVHWTQFLDRTLGAWALHELNRDFENQIGKTRDAYGTVNLSDITSASKRFGNLEKVLFALQQNILPFANDLIDYCDKKHLFMHDVYEFTPANKRRGDSELFDLLRQSMIRSANYIKSGEKQIHAIAERTGQIISTISTQQLSRVNLRLQRGVFWMTLALLLLTGVMVWSEFAKDINWNKIQKFVRSLTQ